MNGEEVPISVAAGDFPDTLVATPGDFPFDPASGQRIDVRVVVAAFDGAHWRHLEFHFTYLKLDLARGDSGPAVRDLQQRLVDLGYWLPGVDGQFGLLTQQAVTAFQKVHGLPRDGSVGSATRQALNAETGRPAARNGSGHHVEVDKARQVLFIVDGTRVSWIFNTSTGTEKPYTYGGQQYIAHTPSGTFTIDRQIDGYRESRLGTLYRPKYFTSDGVAVHGAASVPPFPASHGCVRVTNPAMDWIWGTNAMPLGTRVIVY
jgi:lipoprotein-anchoring transpeptidase ErfK/SrfK